MEAFSLHVAGAVWGDLLILSRKARKGAEAQREEWCFLASAVPRCLLATPVLLL